MELDSERRTIITSGGKVDIWSDDSNDKRPIKAIVPPPVGYRNSKCKKCNSTKVSGVIITETADEADPNLICLNCGYWWD